MKFSPQFITNEKGEKLSVILSIKEYQTILEEMEDQEDIRLYDEVKSRDEKMIPFEDYLKSIKKRKHASL